MDGEKTIRMTLKKYSRLVLVSILPLMLTGYFAAKLIWPHDPYAYITCAPFFLTGDENCRSVGDGSLYDSVKGEHSAWFDVQVGEYDEDAYLHDFVEASARIIPSVEIVSATPFVGNGPDVKSFMGSLAGRRAVMNLGIPDEERSLITDEVVILYCNDLWLDDGKDEYTSGCYGNGWSGPVTYRVNGAGKEELDSLRTSIEEKISDRRDEYNLYRIIMYPIFVYTFFLVSFLIWLVARAVRYVKNG